MASIVVRRVLLLSLVSLALLLGANGLKYTQEVKNERRPAVFLDSFVFYPGGVLNASLSMNLDGMTATTHTVGLFAVISKSQQAVFSFTESRCPLDPAVLSALNGNHTSLKFHSLVLSNDEKPVSLEVNRALQGMWRVHLVVCGPISSPYKAKLVLSMDNVDSSGNSNYLPAGEIPMPWLFLYLGAGYFVLLLLWTNIAMCSPHRQVNAIHWIMTILLVFKSLSVFSESFMYFTMAATGEPKGWNIAFYVFQTIRALLLFLIILMIGSGWQMIKAYISDSDKYIFIAVIPLQVAANIGISVCEDRGIRNMWFYFFHVLDIICCILVLLPILRNIEAYQGKADTDMKIKRLLEKLQHLRRFYIIVVAYIYVTRILGTVLNTFLPIGMVWMSSLIVELFTLAFYILAGYEFRPAKDNTFFHSIEDEKQTHHI